MIGCLKSYEPKHNQLPTGKKQYPQFRGKSDVIIEDIDDAAQKPAYGYGGSRKSMVNNSQFIKSQSNDIRKIKDLPVAGALKRDDPEAKNWHRYTEGTPSRTDTGQRGKSRSLANDDIVGSKPKVYGFVGSSAKEVYAGVSSGFQEKAKQTEAPWGSGGNFDTTSYGKKWLDKTDKGMKSGPKQSMTSKPNVMDSIDQERERLESREVNNRDKGAYGAFIEIPSKEAAPQKTGQKSYMEQKKEEYARYLALQNQDDQYQPTQIYKDQDDDQNQDYYKQQLRKQEMEYQLAQEMKNMNKENQENYDADNYYQNSYPEYQAPVTSIKPKQFVAAGGKSIRQDSESNKFTLSGYQDQELKEVSKNKGFSSFETSSKAYGNQHYENMGAVLNPKSLKIYGKQSYSKDKGFNVITGEYVS